MTNKKYYKCCSYDLKNFISIHGIYAVSIGIHPKTKKIFYIYEISEELMHLLGTWSNLVDKYH